MNIGAFIALLYYICKRSYFLDFIPKKFMKMGLDITTCYVHTVGHAKHKGIYIGHTHDVMNVSLRFNPARVSVLRSKVIVGLVLYFQLRSSLFTC